MAQHSGEGSMEVPILHGMWKWCGTVPTRGEAGGRRVAGDFTRNVVT